jgi:hypothetical protein
MNLELLANELLLDVFDYFPAVQLLRTFHGLNTRFDNLICTHFRKHRLDFRGASKKDFDIVCRVNLPLIIDRIVSLGLSDEDEIPQQIYLFRSYGWTLNRFENLRSLSFDSIRSGEMISDILPECSQLIHLNLTACYFGCTQDEILRFINSVWNLPKLIYCYLSLNFKYGLYIHVPTNISLSMEHLSIVGVSYRPSQLADLSEHTPRLRYLAFDSSGISDGEELRTPIPSLTELNLTFAGQPPNAIESLLRHMPNLYQLKVETLYVEMNGYEWETIIRNYLPKLEVFQLKMKFQVNSEKYRKELFKSFRTPFWLKEHQWFIRFHYNLDDKSNMICLYTLPYNFTKLDIFFPVQIQSTCSNNQVYCSYDYVQHLLYRSSATEEIIMSNLHFPNINYLSITLPFNNQLLLLIQKLERLTSLEVSRPKTISDDDAQSQLQALLDHAPYLYSLKFQSWPEVQLLNRTHSIAEKLTPIAIKTQSIRRYNLRSYDHWFNDEDCIRMSYSSLGIHCEVLVIKVKNRTNILYLINSMPNLRALIVHSQDDVDGNFPSLTDDRFVQWLKQNLPSTHSVKRDLRLMKYIRIWIQK